MLVVEDGLLVYRPGGSDEELEHIGVKYRSGRYPYGSGEDPYQHDGDFLSRVDELEKSGMKESEIVKALGFKTTKDFRNYRSVAVNERRRLNVDRAKSLKADGLSTSEIGRQLGVNESTVRSWLNASSEERMNRAQNTAIRLREEIAKKDYIDVGKGVERELGVTRNRLDEALEILQQEGYNVIGVSIPQATNNKHRTIVKVLAKPGDPKAQQKELYNDYAKIQSFQDYYSEDGGKSWRKREYPASISSKRIEVRYAEDGGTGKDGVIEIRRGVKDLDLGNSHYAQVRILVDGTHYLKGMAIYSDDLPDGVDIMFNTNKHKGTPMIEGDKGVLKPIKNDPDNPFGAYIKANGQSFYDDPNGKYTDPKTGKKQSLSAINKLKEEGEWDTMAKTLSSQFLSKQPLPLIKKQLDLTYADYESRLDEIMSCPNPTVKRKLLGEFADECDSAVTHLKAAALPRQSTRVLIPVPELKDNEVYAPYLKDGEHVVLVRFPHGGTFEIPQLTVNNKNPAAKKTLGPNTIDAIGINQTVAEQLSGADFDGDTALVIPVNSRVRISTRKPFAELQDFDPKTTYAYHDGMTVMTKANTQKQMGVISNLITDMTLAGATDDELIRAVKHSMVVIDAAKHKLDYKQSEKDNRIAELKKKYQAKYDSEGNLIKKGGASTLLSRRKQTIRVDERKPYTRIDPETGEVVYQETGRKYKNAKGELVKAQSEVSLLAEVRDLRTLSSGTPQEEAYAAYGNKLKSLANRTRLAYLAAPKLEYNPSAAKTYATEVASLKSKLNIASLNAPKERRAQAIANSIVKAKIQDNPELADKANKKDLAKVQNAAIDDARVSVGAKSRKDRNINITAREWEAIQVGALHDSVVASILDNMSDEQIAELAMPKTKTTLSSAKVSKINAMKSSGYTIAEIAEQLGVSTSTVSKYMR